MSPNPWLSESSAFQAIRSEKVSENGFLILSKRPIAPIFSFVDWNVHSELRTHVALSWHVICVLINVLICRWCVTVRRKTPSKLHLGWRVRNHGNTNTCKRRPTSRLMRCLRLQCALYWSNRMLKRTYNFNFSSMWNKMRWKTEKWHCFSIVDVRLKCVFLNIVGLIQLKAECGDNG